MRVAIYSRKSHEDTLGSSVDRQLSHAREYAERKGWRVLDDHQYVDDGISGAEFRNRPALLRLLNAAASMPRPFDALVMADSDRLGRDRLRTELAALGMHEAGVRIFYYLTDTEERLDTAEARFVLSARSFGSEIERDRGKQRTRDAMLAKARRGHVTGGVVYGYRNAPVYLAGDSSGTPIRSHVRREIQADEAAVIQAIFQASADGVGLRTIARAMNADPQAAAICQQYFQGRSVLPPRKGTGSWDPSTVNAILHRELYRGTIVWGKHRNVDKGGRTRCRSRQAETEWLRVELPEIRIVSAALWTAVQERRRNRIPAAGPSPSPTSASLFSGLALCAACGGPFTISGSRKRERCYGCSWHRNRGAAVCENSLLESVNVVDRRLVEEIERQVLTPEARRFVVAAAEEAIRRRGEKTADTTADVRNSLSRVTREIENLLRAVEHGDAPATLIERLRQREREQTELRVKLTAQGPKNASELNARRVRRLIEDGLSRLGEVLASDTAAARRALVGLLADKVRFTPTELPSGERTYRFDAKLSMGQLLGSVAQNSVGVPDGI